MKHLVIALCVLAVVSVGCGNAMDINGVPHETFGLFTPEKKDPNVCYRVIVGNVVWSAILVTTIFAPVYFVGFSLWEP